MSKHKITFDWWEAVIEIKDDEKTTENMKEQLLFFMGGQTAIDDEGGDIIKAYLKHMAPILIKESIAWKKEGVIRQITDSVYEGLLPIDGSFGITLLSIDNWEFNDDDFDFTKIDQST